MIFWLLGRVFLDFSIFDVKIKSRFRLIFLHNGCLEDCVFMQKWISDLYNYLFFSDVCVRDILGIGSLPSIFSSLNCFTFVYIKGHAISGCWFYFFIKYHQSHGNSSEKQQRPKSFLQKISSAWYSILFPRNAFLPDRFEWQSRHFCLFKSKCVLFFSLGSILVYYIIPI